MPKRKDQSALGKSIQNKLLKARVPETHLDPARFYQAEQEVARLNKLSSVLEQDRLQEYMQEVELRETKFEATRGVRLGDIVGQTIIKVDAPSAPPDRELRGLKIPRRPKWSRDMTKEQLYKLENEAFLAWRRELARFEEEHFEVRLTPFEKNIEVWRHLWRVVEECDILVQIVDARDPLFFRCEDLEAYMKEVGPEKTTILLLNKADLLTRDMRREWQAYLHSRGIHCLLYSAVARELLPHQPKTFLPADLLHPKQGLPHEHASRR
jgi:large subunit GTPase 1